MPSAKLIARNQVTELVLLLCHLVLDVERTEEDVDAHVEGTERELELEALEDGVDEEAVGLGGVGVGAENRRLNAVDCEGELERLLMNVLLLKGEKRRCQ